MFSPLLISASKWFLVKRVLLLIIMPIGLAYSELPTLDLRNKNLQELDISNDILGRGAYGEVKKCILRVRESDTDTFRPYNCAAKIMSFGTSESNDPRLNELNQLKKLRDLNYKGMPHFFGSLIEGNIIKIVTRLASGNLDSYLKKHPPAQGDNDTLLKMGKEIFDLIRDLHELGIVHGDLKEENVLITLRKNQEPSLHLTDFGSAQSVGGNRKFSTTETHYLPTPNDKASFAQDFFALGVILYHMKYGSFPTEDLRGSKFTHPGQGIIYMTNKYKHDFNDSIKKRNMKFDNTKSDELIKTLIDPEKVFKLTHEDISKMF